MSKSLAEKIITLKGPILVLGASGFIGANLLRTLLTFRNDVFGTSSSLPNWRLEKIDRSHLIEGDLLVEENMLQTLDRVKPRTVLNCMAYGAYSFQNDVDLIYKTNITFTTKLLEACLQRDVDCFIQAGSSSEYGDDAAAPHENTVLKANSHYAVTKSTTANLIHFYGRKKGMKAANLRLYSVYGPYEDSSRLIPKVVLSGLEKKFAEFTDPNISRDFVYIDDACEAFIDAAVNLSPQNYGESFNIGTGVKTTIGEVAQLSKEIFAIDGAPQFSFPPRKWDVNDWFANTKKTAEILGWKAKVNLRDGLQKTAKWVRENFENYVHPQSTKHPLDDLDRVHSISAIIACYKDAQAIPEMHERITNVMQKLKLDYEIIFVNDGSPDDSEKVIAEISMRDSRVIGISHSRNFGSQAAFKSGLDMASKNACVLMDGDLQDPPELIAEFVAKWKEGFEVIYGRRVNREAPLYMKIFYKLFYRIFAKFSYIVIPKDAGDFALMDKKVVEVLLQFPERDLFLRGIRAYAGFRQTGIDYVRPERKFGRTTNNLFKNIGWAKKGIFSFSYMPLNMLSAFGWMMLFISAIMMFWQATMKYFFPDFAPPGVTTTLLVITFFGSLNLFAVSIIGEYIAKIFEEVKARPHFIRRAVIKRGNVCGIDHQSGIFGKK